MVARGVENYGQVGVRKRTTSTKQPLTDLLKGAV